MSDAVSLDDDSAGGTQTETESSSTEGRQTETESSSTEGRQTDDRVPESLPLDQVFGVLKNQRRRHVLKYLRTSDGQVSLSDLAEQIAAWENDKQIRQISSSERKRVYVGLYQCHLPKMDEMDIVSFNKPRGTITVGKNADTVFKYIDIAEEKTDPSWHVYSVALAISGGVALGAALLLDAATAVPVLEIAVAFLVVAFLGYSLVSIRWIDSTGRTHQ